MAYKKYYKTFTLENNDVEIQATCYEQSTSYGFHHCCKDMEVFDKHSDGIWTSEKPVFCQYYNRTWERYRFQSVLLATLDKMNIDSAEIEDSVRSLIKNYGGC